MKTRRALAVLAALSAAGVSLVGAPAEATGCHPAPHANCAGADLSGRNLEGVDLSGANLRGANLSGARLSHAKLVHADLTHANLSGARMLYTNLQGANLNHVRMDGANAQNANLASVLLQQANLARSDLHSATLTGSQLDGTDLTDANLSHVRAAHANFALAKLTGVQAGAGHFQGANFYGAHVHRTQFNSAYLAQASFHGADFGNTNFIGAHITDTKVTPSNIGSDPSARYYFFQRVYTHVNAYGGSGSCDGSGTGANDSTTCHGHNDDRYASRELGAAVKFGWGSERSNGRRGFEVKGDNHGDAAHLIGEADMGLAAFYVTGVVGTVNYNEVSRTFEDAPRGHVGGPLAIYIAYHHTFPTPGYHMNLHGWLQRTGTAPLSGVPQ